MSIKLKAANFLAQWKRVVPEVSKLLVFTMLFSAIFGGWGGIWGGAQEVYADSAPGLTDIGASYAAKEIEALTKSGIVSGYGDGTFAPQKEMTRAELAKIVAMALNLKEEPAAADAFIDVPSNAWHKGYIGALVKAGITQGISASSFAPDQEVTRQELVVFFIRAFQMEETAKKLALDIPFADAEDIAAWAHPHVALGFKIGFINGVEAAGGKLLFAPKARADRQALARLAYEFIENKDVYKNRVQILAALPPEKPNEPTPVLTGGAGGGGGGGGGGGNTTGTITAPVVASVNAISSSTVEVTFNMAVTSVSSEQFTLDNQLIVSSAQLKINPGNIVVLTTSTQTAGQVYKLSYNGIQTGKSFTGKSLASDVLNHAGSYKGDLQINAQDIIQNNGVTFGPESGQAIVEGTLTLDPGATGSVTLRNIQATNLAVKSGASHTVKLDKVNVTEEMTVNTANQSEPVRITTNGSTQVKKTKIGTKVKLEAIQGTGSLGTIEVETTMPDQQVELTGEFEQVIVSRGAQGIQLSLNAGTKASKIMLNADIKLAGDWDAIASVPLESASGVKIDAPVDVLAKLRAKALERARTAIQALKLATDYSAAIEEEIEAARRLVNTVVSLGGTELEVPTDRLVRAETMIKQAALKYATEQLSVGFAGADSAEYVIETLKLPLMGAAGTTISWSSNDEAVLSPIGVVHRPAADQSNQKVTLTATIVKKDLTTVKQFHLIVISLNQAPIAKALERQYIFNSQADMVLEGNQLATDPEQGSLSVIAASSDHEDIVKATVTGRMLYLHPVKGGTASVTAKVSDPQGLVVTNIVQITVVYVDIKEYGSLGNKSIYMNGNSSFADNIHVRLVSPSGLKRNYSRDAGIVMASDGTFTLQTETGMESGNWSFEVVAAAGTKEQSISVGQILIREPAKPTNLTDSPSIVGSVLNDGMPIKGNSSPGAHVVARNGQSEILAAADADGEGHFTLNLQKELWLKSNESISITAKLPDLPESNPLPIAVAASSVQTPQPTLTGELYTDGGAFEIAGPLGSIMLMQNESGQTVNWNELKTGALYFSLDQEFMANKKINLYVRQPGKAPSEPLVLTVQPVNGKTTAPVVATVVYENTNYLSGYTEPYSKVKIRKQNGLLVAQATSSRSGMFNWHPDTTNVKAGEKLIFTADAYGKTESEQTSVTVSALTGLTKAPNVSGAVYTNGGVLSGEADERSDIYFRRGSGIFMQSHNNKIDFSAVITSVSGFSTGESVMVSAIAPGKAESEKVVFKVQPVQGKSPRPLVSPFYEGSNSIKINNAEDGFIVITRSDGTVVSRGATLKGLSETYFYKQSFKAGEVLQVALEAFGKQISDAVPVIVLSSMGQTPTPKVTGSVYADGVGLSIYNVYTYGTLRLTREDGTIFFLSDIGGSLKLSFTAEFIAGEILKVTVQSVGMRESDPVYLQVLPISGQTPVPSVSSTLYDLPPGSSTLSGQTLPYSVLILTRSNGESMGTGNADERGIYTMTIQKSLVAGETLRLISDAPGMAKSEPKLIQVQAAVKTAKPSVASSVYIDQGLLSVRVENYSKITVKKANGTILWDNWAGNISFYLDVTKLVGGEQLTLTATEAGKKESDPFYFTVLPLQGKTGTPTMNGKIYDTVTGYIYGYGESNAKIEIKRANGTVILSTTASYDGYFSYYVYGNLVAGEIINLTAKVYGKAESDPVYITVARAPQATAPTVTSNVYTDGGWLEGKTEGYATLLLKRNDGTEVAWGYSSWVYDNVTGSNSYQYSMNLMTHTFVEGEVLQLAAREDNKSFSNPVYLTVLPVRGTTATPSVNGTVYAEISSYLYGSAEPRALVVLKKENGGTSSSTYANSNGSFSLYTDSYSLREGERLTLTADAAGKAVSSPIHLIVLGKPQLPKPTGVISNVYADGGVIRGYMSVPAELRLTDASGGYIASRSVNGSFTFIFSSNWLTSGQILNLTAYETYYKPSDPILVPVLPVEGTTSTPTVKGVVYEQTNSSLSGRAEPYSIVELRTKDNQDLIARTDADAQGSYAFSFYLPSRVMPNQYVILTADAYGKMKSNGLELIVTAIPETTIPTVTGSVYTSSSLLQGVSEPNAYILIDIPSYGVLGAYSDWKGQYSLSLNSYMELKPGTLIQIKAQASGKRWSLPRVVTVLATPSVTLNVYKVSMSSTASVQGAVYQAFLDDSLRINGLDNPYILKQAGPYLIIDFNIQLNSFQPKLYVTTADYSPNGTITGAVYKSVSGSSLIIKTLEFFQSGHDYDISIDGLMMGDSVSPIIVNPVLIYLRKY
ncbi:Ig-like domain-containing protein [Paenibacillus radicis (ex Xue et al. 2023)]|uniref:Ig-like domain-containing protein n=1 Tax=Paenibacillus radicis (ex Xue et al. 2023) TaxID=2972489 RepID=A0ABT1YR87_9BACL|nr:Ig-like domain-containing protein [Paenibacillus radicis (ex Xue et al. 2023)]MCR8635547.1 Ig-like domain-containing protein [Paenibacillus radicis (ex Xue et al. 2023)]